MLTTYEKLDLKMWDELYFCLFNASKNLILWLFGVIWICEWTYVGFLSAGLALASDMFIARYDETNRAQLTGVYSPCHHPVSVTSLTASTITLSSILVLWSVKSSYSRLPTRLVSPRQARWRSWFLMKILSSFSNISTLWYRWGKSPRVRI